ncbi:hypothetical protein BGZ61DRAFT_24825 [Ilyonectria robusta]|uniref:uncharacterized protein n=1 Tax=Ilyonectria robusta TaxID=1079257 RepID=UPI001E8E7D5C|nr:uncharacterized protein BGZ61DRAFT_24825 [Ilyonectria robusta]KAH8737912.1 hypothetical protein BGZ61DRAFT_24825 [Ilyonectria robusta]
MCTLMNNPKLNILVKSLYLINSSPGDHPSRGPRAPKLLPLNKQCILSTPAMRLTHTHSIYTCMPGPCWPDYSYF